MEHAITKNDASVEFGEYQYKYFLPELDTKKDIPYRMHARAAFDGQLPNRPKEVFYCKKCVVSNQRPRITFDKNGVCSACNYAEYKKTIDWDKRRIMFEKLCDEFRRNDGRWDCLVPCSGGKDSGSLAHKLKYKYGMHPLCVTWSPLLYTNLGFQNLHNMTLSGLDSYLASPNRLVQRKLSRLCLVKQGDHFEAFSRGQNAFPIHTAIKEGIRLIMWGEMAELEYGGDTKNKDIPCNNYEDLEGYVFKNTSLKRLLRFGVENGYLNSEDINEPSLKLSDFPSLEDMKKAGTVMRWYGWYHNWVPQENYYYTAENYGFQALQRRSESTYSKYASLDDLTDPFHYYMGFIKFGIGRTTSDAAHEIRDGHMTRKEGAALVHRYDQEFPAKYFKEFLRYLDITEQDFWGIVDEYRAMSPHIWEKKGGNWVLRNQVS